MNIGNVEGVTVLAKVLASFLCMTDRRIRDLEKEETVLKAARGKYRLIESVQRYINYIKTTKVVDTNSIDKEVSYDDERAIHERIKREKAELLLAALKGSMHRAEDVQIVKDDMLTNFKSKTMNLPAKIAPMLANIYDPVDIQKVLVQEIIEALEELIEYEVRST